MQVCRWTLSRGYAAEFASVTLQRDTSKEIPLLTAVRSSEQFCDLHIGWLGTRLVYNTHSLWHVHGLDGEFASMKPSITRENLEPLNIQHSMVPMLQF